MKEMRVALLAAWRARGGNDPSALHSINESDAAYHNGSVGGGMYGGVTAIATVCLSSSARHVGLFAGDRGNDIMSAWRRRRRSSVVGDN